MYIFHFIFSCFERGLTIWFLRSLETMVIYVFLNSKGEVRIRMKKGWMTEGTLTQCFKQAHGSGFPQDSSHARSHRGTCLVLVRMQRPLEYSSQSPWTLSALNPDLLNLMALPQEPQRVEQIQHLSLRTT